MIRREALRGVRSSIRGHGPSVTPPDDQDRTNPRPLPWRLLSVSLGALDDERFRVIDPYPELSDARRKLRIRSRVDFRETATPFMALECSTALFSGYGSGRVHHEIHETHEKKPRSRRVNPQARARTDHQYSSFRVVRVFRGYRPAFWLILLQAPIPSIHRGAPRGESRENTGSNETPWSLSHPLPRGAPERGTSPSLSHDQPEGARGDAAGGRSRVTLDGPC